MIFEALLRIAVEVVFAACEAVVRRVARSERHARHERHKPADFHVRRAASAYRAWAEQRALTWDGGARGWAGRVAGCAVRVQPGLEGSSPAHVLAELEVAHARSDALLLLPSSRRAEPLTCALGAVFDDDALAGHLRTIALHPQGIRLRLDAMCPPDVVERAVEATIRAVAAANAAVAPYR